MFCSECGNKITDRTILFCPECGTKVEWDDDIAVGTTAANAGNSVKYEATEQSQTANTLHNTLDALKPGNTKSRDPEDLITGIILTNTMLLAGKLSVDREDLIGLLEDFIEKKSMFDVQYRLVDVSGYTFRKSGFLGRSKTVQLDLKSSIWDYMSVLMDAHDKNAQDIEYMFIIGGDDIIPMPMIRQYLPQSSDKTIDTDLIYAYPYGPEMGAAIENQQIFTYTPLYHIGRLPLPTDASASDLVDYLNRDLQYSDGIPLSWAYGQCDPHWKMVSSKVSAELAKCGMLPDLNGKVIPEAHCNGLILSPIVDYQALHQVFTRNAALYYFNLHGSNAAEDRGYFGESLESEWCTAIVPEHMTTCEAPNIILTEACYGGRFIDFDRNHSMVMSALFTNTLAFVGSSRIAWGCVDNGASSPDEVGAGNADILSMVFFHALLQGGTVAESLYLGKAYTLNSREIGDPKCALTATEFNLFGDPTMKLKLENQKSGPITVDPTLIPQGKAVGCTYKCISEKKESSILDMVRGAVDENLKQMHSMVNDYLYSQYNIEPRSLDSIFRINYPGGKEELSFCYDNTTDEKHPNKIIVTTDAQGGVKDVLTSK